MAAPNFTKIEHYVDPEGAKAHKRFSEIKDIELALLDRHTQLSGQTTTKKVSVGTAVQEGIVDNETLGYFLARISLFLDKIGIDKSKIRFRQHMVCFPLRFPAAAMEHSFVRSTQVS